MLMKLEDSDNSKKSSDPANKWRAEFERGRKTAIKQVSMQEVMGDNNFQNYIIAKKKTEIE
jgi:hypothetical protein